MSAPGSVYDAKKPPSKDDYELDDLPEVTQGTVTPVGIPPRGDPEYEAKLAQLGLDPNSEHGAVQRNLKERHLAMIAIGGTIGTGLFVGSGTALAQGGPVGVWLSYIIMGTGVYAVMVALGELCTLFPVPGAITHMATRFVDPAMGFALGYNYWYSWAITTPVELSAIAIVISYWDPDQKIHPAVWIAIFFVLVCAINFLGVKWYGESEFIGSTIKVLAIIGLIILGIVIDLGGGPNGDRIGFRYWIDPGPFNSATTHQGEKVIGGSLGHFLAFFSTFITSAFSFIGTEIVAVTVGEARNPRRAVPRAIRRVFFRIVTFYILGIFVISLIVPYNDPRLLSDTGNAASSPFTIAVSNAGIKVLPSIVNAIVLVAAWSAANSDVYAASRTLLALSLEGKAPKIFRKCTPGGLPIYATALTASLGLLAFMGTSTGTAGTVFNWLYNLSASTGLIAWVVILGSYLRFYYGLKRQGIDRRDFPFVAPFQPYLSWYGFIFFLIVIFFSGYTVFLEGNWNTSDFFSYYLSVIIFPIVYFGWKITKRTRWIRLNEMDFMTGRRELDEIDAFEQERAATKTGPWNKFLSILF